MDIKEKISKICSFFLTAAIILITGLIVYTNLFHYCYKMNADIASEAVLASYIWESGEWLPKSWYPSTELRFFQTPNLASLLYGIKHNMNLAMGIACSIMTLGILMSAYFFICQCSFQREEKLIFVLLCLIIPNNFVILELFYLFGAYYAIHVIIPLTENYTSCRVNHSMKSVGKSDERNETVHERRYETRD